MKVSTHQLRRLLKSDLPATDILVDKINRQLGSVEQVIDLTDKYKDVIIVKVVSAQPHPDADRLSVTKIDDGRVCQNVERDEAGLVQVVCGAPNVKTGMFAAWLPPRSTVPASYGDAEPFVLTPKKLRGVMSQGMLAAADELDLGSDHDGIIEIDPEESNPRGIKIEPGVKFARAYGLDDTIIDIENKMFTHRPDLFGQIGVAREIYAILGGITPAEEGPVDTRFENPEQYWRLPQFEQADSLDLTVFNDAIDKVPRAMFVAMSDVTVKSSPLWLQCELVAMGAKPINNIVDATNYIMLTTAQPVHAYDYAKISGHTIGARMAHDGEKITLLNDKEYELTPDDIVIADDTRAIGLGGIMGGNDSEVDETTKSIILEVATFDMYAVRKSSMRHGLFTDALTRFNKGQSPLQNNRVLSMLMAQVESVTGATQASDVYDVPKDRWTGVESVNDTIVVSADFINQRLGTKLTTAQIGNLLRRANFASWDSDTDDNSLEIGAPFWRTDIAIAEDIVEEVGRLYDFGELPRTLPRRSIAPASEHQSAQLKRQLRHRLAQAGANEVLTYSFVPTKLLEKSGQVASDAYTISNALSPDLEKYRLSLTPSLIDKVHPNIKAGAVEFALFEFGKGHSKAAGLSDGVPLEQELVGLTYAAKTPQPGAAYFKARRCLDQLGVDFTIEQDATSLPAELIAPFEKTRLGAVRSIKTGQLIGVIGEYRSSVAKAFKLPSYSAGFELCLPELIRALDRSSSYQPLGRYPSSQRDMTFRLSEDVSYQTVVAVLDEVISSSELVVTFDPQSIYKEQTSDYIHMTFTFRLSSPHHTLAADEIDGFVQAATQAVATKLAATVV